jgi:hypothetical protein
VILCNCSFDEWNKTLSGVCVCVCECYDAVSWCDYVSVECDCQPMKCYCFGVRDGTSRTAC